MVFSHPLSCIFISKKTAILSLHLKLQRHIQLINPSPVSLMESHPFKELSRLRTHLVSLSTTIQRKHCFALAFFILFVSSILAYNLGTLFDPQSLFGVFWQNNLQTSSPTPGDCDYSNGRWVWDEKYPLQYYTENCPFLDPGFQCRRNGREDEGYRKWRWTPQGCDLPTFNATELLERSRNGRIVFAGDSIGRNQWESLLCMLAKAVTNLSTIYEVNSSPITKHRGFLSMRFSEYNLTVEYFRAPFLVLIGHPPRNSPDEVRATIRVDELHWYSKQWVGADILVFNAGHWWNDDKTTKMGCFFQEGGKVNMTMGVLEAFRRSLQTLKSWALENLDPERTHLFFRSYSPVHYRNGTWNEGGLCDADKEPERRHERLEADPENNLYISNIIEQMNDGNRRATFLNITHLSEFRKDGHPSKYREPGTPPLAPQDCSHWCLPGVPDTWNELLYAQILSKGFRKK